MGLKIKERSVGRIEKRRFRSAANAWKNATLVALLALMSLSFMESAQAKESSDDEYNFSWLDPDKKIYVLQNRRYQKANRALLSGMVGVGWSNPYRSTFNIDPRLAFYFSETLGFEVFYTMVSNSGNSTYEALRNSSPSSLPIIREITSQYGALLHWVPWYAKINMFNQILYFDWYISGGLGQIKSRIDTNRFSTGSPVYENQDLFAFFVGTGHQYHLSESFLVRLDVTGAFYQAQIYGNSGDKKLYSNYNFTFGIGFKP